jgi:hypothetical protein
MAEIVDHSKRPRSLPHRTSARAELKVIELRAPRGTSRERRLLGDSDRNGNRRELLLLLLPERAHSPRPPERFPPPGGGVSQSALIDERFPLRGRSCLHAEDQARQMGKPG